MSDSDTSPYSYTYPDSDTSPYTSPYTNAKASHRNKLTGGR
jgi:hypothetical protein